MATAPPASAPAPAEDAAPQRDLAAGWEIVRQWRRALRVIKWVLNVAIVVAAIVVVSEAFRYYDFFARIHWLLGWAYIAAVVLALVLLVGLPVYRYLRLPVVIQPPDVPLAAAEVTPSDLARRARFVHRYCRNIGRNPEFVGRDAEIATVAEEAAALAQAANTATSDNIAEIIVRQREFEGTRVDPLLAELDAKVDAYVRREAVSVGIATAVSMNGTLDAFIVLWRNVNLVSRIARYYYGRPNLRGSLRILRDVSAVVVLSRAMDDLSDMAGDLVGKTLGNLAGVFVGPVVDGTINALMTMKVGYLAKRRCRSFEAWTERTARGVLADVLRRVTAESAGIVKELLGRVGGFGARAANAAKNAAVAGAGAVAAGGKSAWAFLRGLFARPGESETTGAAGAQEASGA